MEINNNSTESVLPSNSEIKDVDIRQAGEFNTTSDNTYRCFSNVDQISGFKIGTTYYNKEIPELVFTSRDIDTIYDNTNILGSEMEKIPGSELNTEKSEVTIDIIYDNINILSSEIEKIPGSELNTEKSEVTIDII